MEGRICHRWHSEEGINYAYLLDTGNLLLINWAPGDPAGTGGLGGSGAALLELDWGSNVVWEYRDLLLHHDFERLPNGNTLALVWEELSPEMKAQVRGGYESSQGPQVMHGDVVKEITPQGQVVDQWRAFEHLSFGRGHYLPVGKPPGVDPRQHIKR